MGKRARNSNTTKGKRKDRFAPYKAKSTRDNLSFFPTLKLVTANIDGIGTDERKRRQTIKYLEYLLQRFDVACITEARAQTLKGYAIV